MQGRIGPTRNGTKPSIISVVGSALKVASSIGTACPQFETQRDSGQPLG